MVDSVIQIVCICTRVSSHCSIIWWEMGVKISHTSGLNLRLCRFTLSIWACSSPALPSRILLSLSSPWTLIFLWPEIWDISWSFSHLQYCCCCSTPRPEPAMGAKPQKKREKNEKLNFVYFSESSSFFCILLRVFSHNQWEKWGIGGWSFCGMPISKHPKSFRSFM